jgi:hypothetical protein
VLDYTTGSFPVTFADASLDPKEGDYQPCNWADRLVWQSCKEPFFCLQYEKLADSEPDSARQGGFIRWSPCWIANHGASIRRGKGYRHDESYSWSITAIYGQEPNLRDEKNKFGRPL